jgi:hypothetical protein
LHVWGYGKPRSDAVQADFTLCPPIQPLRLMEATMTVDQPDTNAPHIGAPTAPVVPSIPNAPTVSFDPDLAAQIDLSVTERFLGLFASPGDTGDVIHLQTFADGPDDAFEMASRTRKDGSSYTMPRYRLALPNGKTATGDIVITRDVKLDTNGDKDTVSFNNQLVNINLCRGGVFWTVNQLEPNKRRSNDAVTHVRAVFLDLDGAPLPADNFPLLPTAIVESSLGKWHVYWAVVDMPLDRFTTVQKYLAAKYGGDVAVSDLARVMRLPGFFHSKREPFLTRLVEANPTAHYTTAELLEAFAGLANAFATADQAETDRLARVAEQQAKSQALRDESATMHASNRQGAQDKYVQAALWGEVAALGGTLQGGRNSQLYKSAARLGNLVGTGKLDRALVEYELTAAAISIGLGDHETRTTLASGLDHGIKQPLQLGGDGFLVGVGERAGKKAGKAAKTKGTALMGVGSPNKDKKKPQGLDLSQLETWTLGDMFCVVANKIGIVKEERIEGDTFFYSKDLCTFSARIIAETARDDGSGEVNRFFTLEGTLSTGRSLPECEVAAADFAAMNWPTKHWGAQAVVHSGNGTKDLLRAAIQSRNLAGMDSRTIYAHTGWRNIDGHGWTYLHAGGGITAKGAITDVCVSLSPRLKHYNLPAPASGTELQAAVNASLSMLDIAPDTITVPLWLTVWRAVIMVSRFTVFLYGRTGSKKTGLAALLLQHFGADHNRNELPGSWESSDNALESLLFEGKDTVMVVDDFNPRGGPQEAKKWHSKADRVLRGQANGSSRARMVVRPGGIMEMRADRPPRGLCVVTGEDVPQGQSLQARLLLLEVGRDAVNLERLKAASTAGTDGTLATLMAAYLQWLAPQLDTVRQDLAQRASELQSHFPASHGQNSDQGAHLLAGFEVFSRFALESNALTPDQAKQLGQRVKLALGAVVASQSEHQTSSDPVNRFLELLNAVLSSGRAHIADVKNGEVPTNPDNWGWRMKSIGTGDNQRDEYQAQGKRIGWLTDTGAVYLEPETAFAEVQALATNQGEGFSKSPKMLWKALAERHLIISDAKQNTIRATVQGSRQRIVHLVAGAFGAAAPDNSEASGMSLEPYGAGISSPAPDDSGTTRLYSHPPHNGVFAPNAEPSVLAEVDL